MHRFVCPPPQSRCTTIPSQGSLLLPACPHSHLPPSPLPNPCSPSLKFCHQECSRNGIIHYVTSWDGLFHSVWFPWDPPQVLCVSRVHPFLWLHGVSWCGRTAVYWMVPLGKDIWIVSDSWLLQAQLLLASCTGFWVNRSFSLSGGKCPQIQLLGSIVSIFHFVRSHHNFFFSEWLYQFTFQPMSDRVSPHLHQHLVLSLCFILAILIVG